MPKMKPLKEWICDTCRESVDIAGGWVEWLSPSGGGGPHSFRIVHNRAKCQQHTHLSNIELMTEKQVLDFKLAPRPEQVGDKPSKQLKECEHRLG